MPARTRIWMEIYADAHGAPQIMEPEIALPEDDAGLDPIIASARAHAHSLSGALRVYDDGVVLALGVFVGRPAPEDWTPHEPLRPGESNWRGAADEPENPYWDEELSRALQGAYVLVGLTYVDANQEPLRREQFHGCVTKVDRRQGIVIECRGSREGSTRALPPHPSAFSPADPTTTFRLKGSREAVTGVQFTATWTLEQPSRPPARD
ncbi:MAG: hypothetical protein SFY95_03640 [Planctomycetota bacterium]|nr:hypothetical protein [Planctomycetota bacterium]